MILVDTLLFNGVWDNKFLGKLYNSSRHIDYNSILATNHLNLKQV